jgi:exosortase/archaeosortase family protein
MRRLNSALTLRAIVFLVVFAVLQVGWQALRGSPVERFVVHDATVRPAAQLVNLLTPGVHAEAVKFSLRAPGGGLNILNGCEGIEALFLLFAAFAVAPLSWRSKLAGFFVGALVVFPVNQLRILTLFYAYRSDHALFELLHSTVSPIAVVLVVAGYFYGWLIYANPPPAPAT